MREIRKLSNGITVVAEHTPQFRTASVGIFIKSGSAFENSANNGISHLIEHMLFKGTSHRNTIEIADEIVKLGDDVNAYTSKEFTSFYGTTLKELLPRLIELFADMLLNSLFDEKDIEKEKKIIAEEIAMYEDSPEDLVHERLQQSVWENHPLGFLISGRRENVEAISRDDIIAHMGRFYTGNNTIISVAGAFDESIFDTLEKCFSKLPAGEELSNCLTLPEYHKNVLYIKKRIDQLHMNIAFPSINAASQEQYAAAVFQSAFGGSNNSVLFQTIREELGLAYSVYSYNNTFLKAGLMHIDVTVDPKEATATLNEIIKLTDKIRKEGFPEEQLENCKEQAVIELIMGNESVGDKMSLNARQLLAYNRLIEQDDQLNKLRKVTGNDVMNFAEKYLDFRKASVCLVGKCSHRTISDIKNHLNL